jgi:hypothetical protein
MYLVLKLSYLAHAVGRLPPLRFFDDLIFHPSLSEWSPFWLQRPASITGVSAPTHESVSA